MKKFPGQCVVVCFKSHFYRLSKSVGRGHRSCDDRAGSGEDKENVREMHGS